MHPHLRIARPVNEIARTPAMYCQGLGLQVLGSFQDHEGFDGVMLGLPGGAFHLEFTHCHTDHVAPTPTAEDLLVLYLPDRQAWEARCTAMVDAGFEPVRSFNPYWDVNGRTFRDPDGYRIVIQNAAWQNVG